MQAMIVRSDQNDYLQLAHTMLTAHRFAMTPDSPPEVFRTPGYPTFIALIDLMSGDWYWAPFVVNGVLVGLLAVLVSLIATQLALPRHASLLAGALIGLSSGTLLMSVTGTGGDVLYTLLYAIAAYLALRSDIHPFRRATVIGIVLGLATLVRPIGILASLPLIFGFAAIHQPSRILYMRATLLALIAWTVVLAPWYARNAVVVGKPLFSTVSTFNITYYNIPMSETFWRQGGEKESREAVLFAVGTTSTNALRSTAYLASMQQYNSAYVRSHSVEYGVFHLARTIPFFVMSGFNVINAVLSHEAPSLRFPIFPTEGENLTRHILAHEWDKAVRALATYWFTTLERISWLIAILAACASPFFAHDERQRILLLFVCIIISNIILVSPVTQARYRVPAEPFIWVAAVYTGATLWQRYRRQEA